ncbi:response regulator [bacterium]|nr:MAG: response regulator [bacterium]
MIIDDEKDLVDFVKIRLEANDYQVVSACDGEEGLSASAREDPDLILLDILIPKIDGFKVCRELKRSPSTAGIPIIMLTAKDRIEDVKLAKEAGADGYIIKPFDSATLLLSIKDQLDKVKRG